MRINILATESLGVRGLCCVVHIRQRHIVIDPGLALGYLRNGLLPHPRQVAAGEVAARCIMRELATATDVVFSHYHGDHIPLARANPYQLPLSETTPLLKHPRLWGKNPTDEAAAFMDRCRHLETAAGRPICYGNGRRLDIFTFSAPMPHGPKKGGMGTVMMTRIQEGDQVFVHASDIQLLDDAPMSVILEWAPDIVFLSGPPLYRGLKADQVESARKRALRLGRAVPCCIIDHHLLRSRSGLQWLDALRAETDGSIQCAADYMQVDRRLLEADRAILYNMEPVVPDWHQSYQRPSPVLSAKDVDIDTQKQKTGNNGFKQS